MEVKGTIVDMTDDGRGVLKDDRVYFIKGAVIGDFVRAEIEKENKNYSEGYVTEIIESSPFRVEVKCKVFGICGGCAFRDMTYARQCQMKKNHIEEKMRRIGKFKDFSLDEFIPSPMSEDYRNRVNLPVRWQDKRVKIGFFKRDTNDITELPECKLVPLEIDNLIIDLEDFLYDLGFPIYSGKRGNLFEVTVRMNEKKEIMLILTVMEPFISKIYRSKAPLLTDIMQDLFMTSHKGFLEKHNIISIVENIRPNRKRTVRDEYITIYGKSYIEERILNVKLELSPNAFFQVNRGACELLYKKALEFANLDKNDRVLDLYCGVGALTILISKEAGYVTGIEYIKNSIQNAEKNAELNASFNTQFLQGRVEDILDSGILEEHTDVIFLDPPRTGVDKKALKAILKEEAKKIIYISCDMATLSRDARYLCDNGYKIEKAVGVDMFPYTTHVECIALIQRVKS